MITLEQARKLLETVDVGLCKGVGEPTPGAMCIEAAVCYALGHKHGDEPTCVANAVRRYKIGINDAEWSSNAARAKGMRRAAIAQLGSAGVLDEVAFAKRIAELTIRRVLPVALRAAGLEAEALRCEAEGSYDAADAATRVAAIAARVAADAATYAAYDPTDAARAATAAYAATRVAAIAARVAADAATYAADAARGAAYVAAYVARVAAYAARGAADAAADEDEILTLAAGLCEQVLREQNAPGIALLDELLPRE